MGGIRNKLLLLLIVYFAGFATAIYTLAPVPDSKAQPQQQKTFVQSAFKSDEFAKSCKTGIDKFLVVAKDAAIQTSEYIKEKINDNSSSKIAKK